MHIISRYLSISYGYVLDMEIRLKLRKIGNSLLITIPSQVVDDLKLKAGDDMLLDVKDATIVVRKKNR
jgi:antitoxin component of MazEF toxin-antitoxin module